jgi:hypothetical protein
MPMTDLDRADRIMALPASSWIMAMEPVTVGDMQNGGKLTLPMGAKVRISCTTRLSAFGNTEDCTQVSFGMGEAACFEPVPKKIPK